MIHKKGLELDNYTLHKVMATNVLKRPNHLNYDKTEEDRIRRIRCISQGFILKKFKDPKVTIEKKYELAEKIFLANIKTDKDQGDKTVQPVINIYRLPQEKIVVEQKIEESSGRRLHIDA